MSRYENLSPNLNAFLDALAWAEGVVHPAHKSTRNDGYDVIVNGTDGEEIFSDYSTHPFARGRAAKRVNNHGLYSTASGRYQFMIKDWAHYKALLNLPDFSPESQDRYAVQLIKERRALPLIESGHIQAAVELCRNLWASLPGAGYGQTERKLNDFIAVYLLKGGMLWDSKPSLPESLPPLSQSLPLSQPVTIRDELKESPTKELEPTTTKLNGLLNLIIKLFKRN